MRVEELFVGALIANTNGNVGKVIGIRNYAGTDPTLQNSYEVVMRYNPNSTCYSDPKMLVPVEITPAILEQNGWFYKNGIWVKLGAPRMGWYEKEKTLIIGFTTFPIVVEHVNRMQAIQRILGAEELTL